MTEEQSRRARQRHDREKLKKWCADEWDWVRTDEQLIQHIKELEMAAKLQIRCDQDACSDERFTLTAPQKIQQHLEQNPDHVITIENEMAYA